MYNDGYHNLTGNDISPVVIEDMKKSQKEKGMELMRYDVMDVRKMDYKDESFDLIIDKSTIDSLMCSDHPLLNVANLI
jgi:ubiquinone/menaquinone biosynthesis C-methylase UbiE